MKPFCSGGTADVDLIQAIQGEPPSRDEVNPFFFAEPVAPLVAARRRGRKIDLMEVLAVIRRMEGRCERLIVEGAGGVLVPLGNDFTVADVIANLECDVVVVAQNRLGVINHMMLTVEALRARRVKRIKAVLMTQSSTDYSARSNAAILSETIANIGVFSLPHLGAGATRFSPVKTNAKKNKITLARIADPDTFSARSSERLRREAQRRVEEAKKDR